MKRLITLAALASVGTTTAEAHYYDGCQKNPCKKHVIEPYVRSFLGPVGACESGTTRWLRHGLGVVSPTGQYRGRYQFDMSSWRGAGGYGDPVNAGWLTQAYNAVRWLHRAGRHAWPNC